MIWLLIFLGLAAWLSQHLVIAGRVIFH